MKENTSFELELAGTNKVSEEKGLTTFQDMEEETLSVFLDVVPPPAVHNPYPDQTPAAILGRWYQITTFSLTKTSVQTAFTTAVWNVLINQQAIKNALYTFRYLKWKEIEIRIQTATMPQIYGWFGFSSLPANLVPDGHPNDGIVAGDNLKLLSFDDTVLFDLAVQNDVTIKIPWRHPEQWCDWYKVLGFPNQVDALVQPTVFWDANPVKVLDSTSTPTINCLMLARFVDPEVSGPTNQPNVYSGQSKFGGFSDLPFDPAGYKEHDDFVLRGPRYGSAQTSVPAVVNKKVEADEPELRNNPVGSLVSSCSRYVCGTGSQVSPVRDYMLSDYLSTPTCCFKSVVSNTVGIPTFSIRPMWRHSNSGSWPDTVINYSRLTYMSQYFRMWRGSIDYTFVFFSTPFLSTRVNIVTDWSAATSPGTIGNEIIQDVTIRGTTVVHVTVPFLNGGQWAPCPWQVPDAYFNSGASVNRPVIALFTIQPAVSVGDVAATIPVLVFERAGKDFEFRSLCNPTPQVDPAPPSLDEDDFVYEGQMRVSQMCAQEVSGNGSIPSLPNSAISEVSIGEMVRRWGSRRAPLAFPGETYVVQSPTPFKWNNNYTAPLLDHLSWIFGFWSGQIKIKAFLPVEAEDQFCWHTKSLIGQSPFSDPGTVQCDRPEDGMSAAFQSLTKIIESTSPFLSTVPILPCPTGIGSSAVSYTSFTITDYPRIWWQGYLHDGTDIYTNADFFYVSAGDDFCFYFPLPPPFMGQYLWPSYGGEPVSFSEPTLHQTRKQKTKRCRSDVPRISKMTTTSSESVADSLYS